MDSRCMMGAIASKNARPSSPVSFWISAAKAGEVRGPVAIITLSHSAGGKPVSSPRSMVISGCAKMRRVTSAENPSRSTASAPPAGTLWSSATAMINDPAIRISSCSKPTALLFLSSERKELEQTSSARLSVLWTSVFVCPRISWSITVMPASAACHAASEPAMPPPIIWIRFVIRPSCPFDNSRSTWKRRIHFQVPPICGFLFLTPKLLRALDWWRLESANSILFLPRPERTLSVPWSLFLFSN